VSHAAQGEKTRYASLMGPAIKPTIPLVSPAPQDEADVRTGLEEATRGEGADLTEEELERWAETGEWPERLG
jgi:hypothetical protein